MYEGGGRQVQYTLYIDQVSWSTAGWNEEQDRDSIAHINARHQYICLANCYLTHSLANYTCKEGGTKHTSNTAYTDRKYMTNQ